MQAIIHKTIRVPVGIAAKVEEMRGEVSWNAYCVEALNEKAERDKFKQHQ